MSEEKIIKIIKEKIILDFNCYNPIDKVELEAIQGLLDLYQQEKEKNKGLIEGQVKTIETLIQPELFKKYISKDKIRELKKSLQEQITDTRELFFDRSTISEIIYENEIKLLQELLEND